MILSYEENIVFKLRALYAKYGYSRYRMSKFEEYDLYAENKRFLASKNVITFTDTNGKLMALKPDVTLSIIKNCKEHADVTEKVCYDESVYRASGYDKEFQEITQTGLECIGALDDYTIGEVVTLALKSLSIIRDTFVLDLSHTGFFEGLMEEARLNELQAQKMLRAAGSKNLGEIKTMCAQFGISDDIAGAMCALVSLYGPMGDMLKKLRPLCIGSGTMQACDELERLWEILKGCDNAQNINLDFSMTSEPEYYSGVVFKGYVSGVPAPVLSGGRYDRLMEKLGKRSGAIGFAVYMDMLERLDNTADTADDFDVDVLLLYADADSPGDISRQAAALTGQGMSVMVQKAAPAGIRSRRLMRMENGKAVTVEKND